MKSNQLRRWKIIRFYMVGWTLSFLYLSVVRGVGTEELGELKFDFLSSLMISSLLGPSIGLISGIVQVYIEERVYRKISIRHFLFLRLIYAVLFVAVMVLVAYVIYGTLFGQKVDIMTFAFDKGSGAITIYVITVDFFLNVLRQISMMLGEGNLSKFLLGKFYTPREENRIFMFLDLQSSTQLAEQLGHNTYSLFIQDCFNDLSVVAENEAEIYQYVGDEAVLTWNLKNGLKNENCIRTYFRFMQQLDSKKEYYLDKYGVQPFFKAGLHCGPVMVTEIGRYKREIAYHGDAMNTTARIQGKCNEYGVGLLISNDIKELIPDQLFHVKQMGQISLRGKKEEVVLHSVDS
ncbi:MAG: adenylate/guanylate cyclase domain-containing protein [bacterium]|nr:adenylate/guanylate cyclase domain-containing protein [bacterium]